MTKLKPLWNREVPVGGNMNTPGVSKYSMAKVIDNKIFLSTHTANYKQVIEFNPDPRKDKNLMSIDTGMSGNLFGGNYFTMNAPHLRGELNQVTTSFRQLERGGVENAPTGYILKIHPVNSKKKRVIRPHEEYLVDEKKLDKKFTITDEEGEYEAFNPDDPDGINEYYRQ